MDEAPSPLLAVSGLDIRFRADDGEVHAVKGVDFTVGRGESIAIVGESGSGKSQAVMALLRLTAVNGVVTGTAHFDGRNLIGLDDKVLDTIRGRRIAMIFQEPMTSLDPLTRVGDQIGRLLVHHGGLSRRAAEARVLELLTLVNIDDPAARRHAYPHELSGGQRQRVMIAMALANKPELLIADEPTTALDVTVQAQILDLIGELRRQLGLAVILISHDLGVVRRVADRTYVMRNGEIVEDGPTEALFARPRHGYTRLLVAAEPTRMERAVQRTGDEILAARDVTVSYVLRRGLFGRQVQRIAAVRGVSITLQAGETLGIVGESGSGKSTLGRALLRLAPIERGTIAYAGRPLEGLSPAAMRPLRRDLQMVFQDPYGSVSPRLTAGEIVTEGLRVHEPGLSRRERDRRAAAAFLEVWLDPALRNRFPHEFSGGQRQRLAIARAILLRPKLVVLDEPTSALDRTVQKGIVELLRYLQDKHGMAYLFISHDLAVVRALADRVMVMKSGLVVENGPVDQIFAAPQADYTKALIAAAFAPGVVPAA